MDDTKKTLLSIDLDTDALTKNAKTAKDAIKELTDQLTALKTAGQANTPVFNDLSTQLKTTTKNYTDATKAITDYSKALADKATAEQADAKTTTTNTTTTPGAATQQTANTSVKNTVGADTSANTSNSTKNNADASPKPGEASKTVSSTAATSQKASDSNSKLLTSLTDYNTAVGKINQTALDQEIKLLDTKNKAYEDSAAVIAGVYDSSTVAGKAALIAKKSFGAAEIAMNTETQISSIISGTVAAVSQDLKLPIPVGPVLAAVDTAGGVVKVAGAVLNGAQQISKLNSITVPSTTTTAKGKARGGIFESDGMGAYLTGPGNGTSDSINARLSNGESVINARSTAMFGPILSAINQIGGGVAFHSLNRSGAYATGGLFNGSNTLNDGSTDLANTRAMNDMAKTLAANLPRQVLVVEDVQASLQNKVMLQNMSNF